jgi:hypothetical protein
MVGLAVAARASSARPLPRTMGVLGGPTEDKRKPARSKPNGAVLVPISWLML